MEILLLLGLIILGFMFFLGSSAFGWILKGFDKVFSLLMEGFNRSLGCLIWGIIIFLMLLAFIT